MSATNGKKSCDKSVCDYNDFRRPRYFHGKLLDDKDFTAEQNYHAGKRRLLNRMLYGSGVVCGLDLNWKKGATWLDVNPGMALDGEGSEIWVETTAHLDVSKLLPPDAKPKVDCPQTTTTGNTIYYLAICYKEAGTDPAPVYLPGSTCDDRTCEYSSNKEGFCLKLVTECPKPQAQDGLLKALCQAGGCTESQAPQSDCEGCDGLTGDDLCRCYELEKYCDQSVTCADPGPCGQGQCVILGRVEIDTKGAVQDVCINDCREYVISGRLAKYLIASTLSGIGSIFTVGPNNTPFMDGADIARNPIQALCWVVRNFVIQQNDVNTSGCTALFGSTAKVSTADFSKLKEQVATDIAAQKATGSRVDKLEAMQGTVQAVPAQVAEQQKMVADLTARLAAVEKQAGDVTALNNRVSVVEKQALDATAFNNRLLAVEKRLPPA